MLRVLAGVDSSAYSAPLESGFVALPFDDPHGISLQDGICTAARLLPTQGTASAYASSVSDDLHSKSSSIHLTGMTKTLPKLVKNYDNMHSSLDGHTLSSAIVVDVNIHSIQYLRDWLMCFLSAQAR